MDRDPKTTAATTNTIEVLLFGMEVSTLEAQFYLRGWQSEAIVALRPVVRKRMEGFHLGARAAFYSALAWPESAELSA
jgi:hypothetical protein